MTSCSTRPAPHDRDQHGRAHPRCRPRAQEPASVLRLRALVEDRLATRRLDASALALLCQLEDVELDARRQRPVGGDRRRLWSVEGHGATVDHVNDQSSPVRRKTFDGGGSSDGVSLDRWRVIPSWRATTTASARKSAAHRVIAAVAIERLRELSFGPGHDRSSADRRRLAQRVLELLACVRYRSRCRRAQPHVERRRPEIAVGKGPDDVPIAEWLDQLVHTFRDCAVAGERRRSRQHGQRHRPRLGAGNVLEHSMGRRRV